MFGLEQEVRRRDDAATGLAAQLDAAQCAAAAQREVAAEEAERGTKERTKWVQLQSRAAHEQAHCVGCIGSGLANRLADLWNGACNHPSLQAPTCAPVPTSCMHACRRTRLEEEHKVSAEAQHRMSTQGAGCI